MSELVDNKLKNILSVDDANNKQNSSLQEVNDLREILKADYNKYLKYKIISETLHELINKSDCLNVAIRNKVNDILLSSQFHDSSLDNSCSILFGISNSSEELTYTEKDILKDAIERRLNEKFVELDLYCSENRVHSKSKYSTFQLLEEDQATIDLKLKLKHEEEVYINNLFKKAEVLEEIKNLRLCELPKITNEKHIESTSLCKMNHLKSEILLKKIRVDIFTETKDSLHAYKEFIKDLKNQQRDCEKEIDDLLDYKEQYKVVASKQYDDILKSYLQYKASNEKKKMLYDCIKS